MNNWSQKSRNDDSNDDKPPYSRLFIVCSKQTTADDLRNVFEPYGEIESIYLPKNRITGEMKGVAYIKYTTTSAAAQAIESRHLKPLQVGDNKNFKVMVATTKSVMLSPSHKENENKYKRLFIKVDKDATEQVIREYFSTFGHLESVHLQRNKLTDESKGFAYVNYKTFLDAAKAYEQCNKKYKPIFATPKDELKRSRNSLDSFNDNFYSHNIYNKHQKEVKMDKRDSFSSLIKTGGQNYDTVIVLCTPPVLQKYIENLCNIIPGVMSFKYSNDPFKSCCKSIVTYNNEKSAAYAVERLNKFEFPSGEIVIVKPNDNPLSKVANNLTNLVNSFKSNMDGSPDLLQLAEAMAEASNLLKAATVSGGDANELNCSVPLPPVQPLANPQSRIAQTCFLVFKPHPPPLHVIKDAFCRFGNLIDIFTSSNKTFGFAKYATVASAQEAIKTLHDATLNGIRVKVLEADEKNSKESNSMNVDDDDSESKRMKYVKN
ncbi:hypothetical protein K1T71_003691 [Dendrolimus kikuchii]|uniref:Uncharacterized protein n=1 Tax=Dendrolimus kikuchii TaxID=765133 RepID=A0ACC1D8S4_9NEOP|nr:hypothetical protein K1T71_003691 [Dendrolimus kikuchii]